MQVTEARALAIVRIAIGVIFLVRTHGPLVGWPDTRFHVALFSMPVWLIGALALLRTIAAISFTIGVRSREAGVVASVCAYAVLAQDALAYINTLQLLFLSTFIVALADSSVELALRPRAARSMSSSIWLVRAVPLSVYAFSGIAKLNSLFLSGHAVLGLCGDTELRGIVARLACSSIGVARIASIGAATFELVLPVLLVARRTRKLAVVLALAFHATLEISIHPDAFGWIMVTLLLAFIPRQPDARNRRAAWNARRRKTVRALRS